MSELHPYIVYSEAGGRVWQAENGEHALEQHKDAFPDETVRGVVRDFEDEAA